MKQTDLDSQDILSQQKDPSHFGHIIGGAIVGGIYGFMALADVTAAQSTSVGFLMLGGFVFGGAVVGHELFRTRRWTRFGKLGRAARWFVAFGSASAALASILVATGDIDTATYTLAVLLGASLGLGFWLEEERSLWNHAATREERRASWIRAMVVAVIGLAIVTAVALLP